MNDTVDQFVASHKANMEALAALTTQAFIGIEKLVDLNMAASRAALSQSFSHVQDAIGLANPKELLSLQSGLLKPLADKTAAYAEHLQALVTQGGVEFAKAVEARTARSQESFGGLIDNLARKTVQTVQTAQATFTATTPAAADALDKAAGMA